MNSFFTTAYSKLRGSVDSAISVIREEKSIDVSIPEGLSGIL